MNLAIPPTYQEILADKTRAELISFYKNSFAASANNKIDHIGLTLEKIIKKLILKLDNSHFLRQLTTDILTNKEYQRLEAIILNNGRLEINRLDNDDVLDRLIGYGFLFISNLNKKSTLIVPLELCLTIPITKDNHITSLMAFLNNSSFNTIKTLAEFWNIPTSKNKLTISIILYKKMLSNYKKSFLKLSELQVNILKLIYYNGKRISDIKLYTLIDHTLNETDNDRLYYYYNHETLYHFFTADMNSKKMLDLRLTDLQKKLINLVAKGFLTYINISMRELVTIELIIPNEAVHFLNEAFDSKLKQKRLTLAKEMLSPPPDKIVSYSGRILDDFIKLQVAIICELIEVTQKGEIKKRNLNQLIKLLAVDQVYLFNLLRLLKFDLNHDRQVILDIIDHNGLETIQKHLFSQNVYFEKTLALLTTMEDWLKKDVLKLYLANHQELMGINSFDFHSKIDSFFDECVLLGILDRSGKNDIIKPSHLLRQLFEKELPAFPIIKAETKPLVIQPNLEILLPFNTEGWLIENINQFCELIILDKMLHFKLSKESLMKGFEQNWTVQKVKDFFFDYASTEIPGLVDNFLNTIGGKKGEASIIPCSAIIKCTGLGIKEKILALKDLQAFELEGTEDYLVIPVKTSSELIKILKKKGIFAEQETSFPDASDLFGLLNYYKKREQQVDVFYKENRAHLHIGPAKIQTIQKNFVIFEFENQYMDIEKKIYLHDLVKITEV